MKSLFLATALLCAVLSPLCGQVRKTPVCAPETAVSMQQKKHPVHLKLKGIDNNNGSGVTRIGIDLQSIPSTSSRLDSAVLVNGKARLLATDVDGVDFARYFQWEENGTIYVELDFPHQKKLNKGARVILYTVHGVYALPVKNK